MNHDDGPELVGLGRVGRVMRYGGIAVKTANIWPVPENASETTIISKEQMNRTNIESLKHEARVYRHLGHVRSVIEPLQVSDTEIRMPFIRQGSLSSYLRSHKNNVARVQLLRWLRDAAHIVRRVHERGVLVADVATRNFLLNEDLSLQMCDFTESVIVPSDEDMDSFVSEDFVSVKFDLARFGSMMYEVITGSRYEFYVISEIESDLNDDPESKTFKAWPTSERFPDTGNVFLGEIIRECWLEDGFRSMQEVCHTLDRLAQKQTASKRSGETEMMGLNWGHILGFATPAVASIIFAAIIIPHFRLRMISAALPSNRQ